MPTIAPYGSWQSPITAESITTAAVGLSQPQLDDAVYWLESRPLEDGRSVLVKQSAGGKPADLTPPPFNVRTRVHEYGGGAYAVAGGTVYFVNFADQRLYRLDDGGAPRPVTPASDGAVRFADFVIDRGRACLFSVREDHRNGEEAVNTLVRIDATGDDHGGTVIVAGNDFYAAPRLSPDGSRLAWLTWNHPNMPWDGTELWVGELTDDGAVRNERLVAGGADESVFQPEWSSDGALYFVSDRSGWWNLYRLHDDAVDELLPMKAEFGQPQWVFGLSTYGFLGPNRLICTYRSDGQSHLALLDTATRAFEELATPYTTIGALDAAAGQVVLQGSSATRPTAIVHLEPNGDDLRVVREAAAAIPDRGYLSIPEPIEFPTQDGLTAHALYYPPTNCDFVGPAGERPPLRVLSHGGPTGEATSSFNLTKQYWTSRGVAVVDVNYGGSTGYGRDYRKRLDGRWGIVDVDDCIAAARYLVARGDVDGRRLAIAGGSAGGYTTLSVLTFRDAFHVGASHFGVADLEALALHTHKFESRYLDRLIGPYPEARALYRERSPIHHVDRLNCPIILFQGLEDKVVPPSQAEAMFQAVRAKGLPVSYLPFAGEQHGFRRAENIKRALEAELAFYGRILGFVPDDEIEPVAIENS